MSGKRARIPWSRRIRFRLQSLMIAIGVVCIVLGWVIQRAHVQRDSVWAIQRAGGRVMYAWEWRWSKLWPVATKAAGWPHWLTDHIGIDYLSNVTYVEIRHGRIGSTSRADRAAP
jgi:hypothetical protein